jgi:predicted lipid carrier protein YhbT
MVRQDFLLKQIEELGRVLGQILVKMLGLKSNTLVSRQMEEASKALRDEGDLDIDKLLEVPPDKFVQVLQENAAMNDANLDCFAAVLFHIAENTEDRDKSILFYERSLIIYGYLEHSSSIYSFDRSYYMEQIKKALTT